MKTRRSSGNTPAPFQVLYLLLLLLGVGSVSVSAQVCSGIGHMCMRSTDCCQGCCEGYQCVQRSFACSTDVGLSSDGGGSNANSCDKFFCPPGHICVLVEICPPERNCPRRPSCRRYSDVPPNIGQHDRNSSSRTLPLSPWTWIPGMALLAEWIFRKYLRLVDNNEME